jgi:hypothetical protein
MANSRFGTAWRPARVEGPRPQGEVAIGGATPPGASITFPIFGNYFPINVRIVRRSHNVVASGADGSSHDAISYVEAVMRD